MMSTTITRRDLLMATGAASVASTLAACSGSTTEDPVTMDKEVGAPQGAVTKLTLCLDYAPNTNHTGIYVADALGYLADEGIELTIVQPADTGAEAVVVSGEAELGVSYQDYIANVLAADATAPIAAIAAIVQHNTSGIMSRASDGVTHPAAMEGLRYATWEMPVELATVRQIVEADGGNFDAIIQVPYTVDDEVSGLKANLFDTVWVYEGWAVANAAVQDYEVNFFSFISIDDAFDYYTPVIVVNTDFAAAHDDVIRAFLRAVRRGYEYVIANPDKAADILLSAVPELDEALVRESQAFLSAQYVADADAWGVIDSVRWSRFYQWLNDNDLLEHALDINAGWTGEYLD